MGRPAQGLTGMAPAETSRPSPRVRRAEPVFSLLAEAGMVQKRSAAPLHRVPLKANEGPPHHRHAHPFDRV